MASGVETTLYHDPERHLYKRLASWPRRNAGVMVVFVIVFLIAILLISLWIRKYLKARQEKLDRRAG